MDGLDRHLTALQTTTCKEITDELPSWYCVEHQNMERPELDVHEHEN